MNHLAEAIHEDEDPCVSIAICRIAKHKVHADGLPTIHRDWQRVKWSLRAPSGLHPLALFARANVICDPLKQVGPPEVSGNAHICLLAPEMTSVSNVMMLIQDLLPQIRIVWHNHTGIIGIADAMPQQSVGV
jgi:hypothetical protein